MMDRMTPDYTAYTTLAITRRGPLIERIGCVLDIQIRDIEGKVKQTFHGMSLAGCQRPRKHGCRIKPPGLL